MNDMILGIVSIPLVVNPNIPPNWLMAICIPTPVRKPTSAVRDRKSPMKPNLKTLAMIRNTPHKIAIIYAIERYDGLPGTATVTSTPNMIAAVAESAPTIRCREEQKIAKTAIGIKIVYIPDISGIPAILA